MSGKLVILLKRLQLSFQPQKEKSIANLLGDITLDQPRLKLSHVDILAEQAITLQADIDQTQIVGRFLNPRYKVYVNIINSIFSPQADLNLRNELYQRLLNSEVIDSQLTEEERTAIFSLLAGGIPNLYSPFPSIYKKLLNILFNDFIINQPES